MKKIAINGFGRIGRAAFKIASERDDMEVVAINDLTDIQTLAHLLQYDTAYGSYHKDVRVEENNLVVGGKQSVFLSEPDPRKLPWSEMEIDTVLECTGRFVKDGASRAHIEAGAKKVILSAPAKGDGGVPTVLRGINDEDANTSDIISNASCTTNCIGPVMEIMHRVFGVEKAMMTTIHSYTADQRLQDAPHSDMRRARAAAQNIVPTTTGAAIATTKVITDLENKFDGIAVRVPTIVVSLSDITLLLKKDTTAKEINQVLESEAEEDHYQGVFMTTREPLVSSDFIGNNHSSIADLGLTKVVGGNLVKIVAWYDNEWGYSHRLVELACSN
jgi:glyceraldehyde 3-phosphate dehydrogenase